MFHYCELAVACAINNFQAIVLACVLHVIRIVLMLQWCGQWYQGLMINQEKIEFFLAFALIRPSFLNIYCKINSPSLSPKQDFNSLKRQTNKLGSTMQKSSTLILIAVF